MTGKRLRRNEVTLTLGFIRVPVFCPESAPTLFRALCGFLSIIIHGKTHSMASVPVFGLAHPLHRNAPSRVRAQ